MDKLDNVTQLADGDMVSAEQRKADIEKAVARIFEGGVIPESVVIYADLGPGTDQVRVSAAGKTVNLVALAVAGNNALAAMLKAGIEQMTSGNKLNG